MLLPAIKWQMIFYRCINQLLIMRFDVGYTLSAAVAHLDCIFIKYFEKFIGGWNVVTQQLEKLFCNFVEIAMLKSDFFLTLTISFCLVGTGFIKL